MSKTLNIKECEALAAKITKEFEAFAERNNILYTTRVRYGTRLEYGVNYQREALLFICAVNADKITIKFSGIDPEDPQDLVDELLTANRINLTSIIGKFYLDLGNRIVVEHTTNQMDLTREQIYEIINLLHLMFARYYRERAVARAKYKNKQ